MIEVKWNMTTKWRAVFDIAINFIHACILTALVVAAKFDSDEKPYTNLKADGWKIALEISFVLIAIFLIYKVWSFG